jgi:Domain of unknown function (DUF1918)
MLRLRRQAMKAQVGDRLIPDGDTDRIGLVIGLQNADGSPPYVIKWLSGGHIALVSPGPYARILPADPADPADTARPGGAPA